MLLALFRKFSAPGTIKHSLCRFLSFFLPTRVDSGITSLDRWPDHLGMGLVPPPLLWKVLQVSTFPQGMEWDSVSRIMVSHDGTWEESLSTWFPALVKCVMGLHTARCQPVGCFGNVIHLLLFSCEKKYDFWCQPPVGWHILAVGTALLQGG